MSKSIQQMTVEDVAAWLSTIKMDKYAASFQENDIDGMALAQIDKPALAVLGCDPLAQTKIMAGIDRLKLSGAGAVSPPPKVEIKAPPPVPTPPKADKFVIIPIAKNTAEFADVEDKFKAALSNQINCYTKDRTDKGMRPVTFRVVEAAVVQNPVLTANFEACKERMAKAGREPAEMRTRRGFHGTSDKNIELIARNGLLHIGHPQNPSKSTDPGYFGDPRKGVYMACHPDYCLKYSNSLEPLSPGEEVRIVMFDVCPGKSFHVKDLKLGMQPKEGFDSHSSANHLEWFLFNEDQCVPTHILTVRAFENRRVDTDDEHADLEGLPADKETKAQKGTTKLTVTPTPKPDPPKPEPPKPTPPPVVEKKLPPTPTPPVVPVHTPILAKVPLPSKGAMLKHLFSVKELTDTVYAVAVSADNKIWALTHSLIRLFSPDGKLVTKLPGLVTFPQGLGFAANGDAFISDGEAKCVVHIRPDGSLVRQFGKTDRDYNYRQLAVDPKNELVFVAEYRSSRISVFKLDGTFLRAFNSQGKGDGQLDNPAGVAVAASGEVVVAEDGNQRIQVFDRYGNFLRKVDCGFMATAVDVDSAGNFIVCDSYNHGIQVFSPAGELITKFGKEGQGPGLFSYPGCVAVCPFTGRILIGDWKGLQVFSW